VERDKMSFTKLMTMYAIFNATFKSFKALHKSQRFSKLIEDHNSQKGTDSIDEEAVISRLDKQEIIPMLHFWTCFAFIQLYDIYLEDFFSWIPFYYLVKGIILLWIIAPQTRGATVFFESFLTPQIERRMKFFEQVIFPLIRRIIIGVVVWLERIVLNYSLQSISTQEITQLDLSMDRVKRSVTREGYLRRREESILALEEAVPEERHRVALLDDILKEFDADLNDDSDWTELRLANDGANLRIRFGSELETEDELTEFILYEEATVDNGI
jgi:hypothetical protein